MYYSCTDTHYYRFNTELARDEWVSRSPHSRAACEPPADTGGFSRIHSFTDGFLEWKERDDLTPVSPKGWKPMDTAPRDGSPVVIKRGITVQEAWWLDNRWVVYSITCACGKTHYHDIRGAEGWMTYDEAVEFLKP